VKFIVQDSAIIKVVVFWLLIVYNIIHLKPYIFANKQNCWQYYITHPCCQPVFPVSSFLFRLFNFVENYASENLWELLAYSMCYNVVTEKRKKELNDKSCANSHQKSTKTENLEIWSMNCPKTWGNYVRQLICLDKIIQIFQGIKIARQRCVRNIIRNLAYTMQRERLLSL
jgi:hypothetical protein